MKTIRFSCVGRDFFPGSSTTAYHIVTIYFVNIFQFCLMSVSRRRVVFCDPTKTTTERLHVSPLSSRPNKGTTIYDETTTTQRRTNDWHTQNAASDERWQKLANKEKAKRWQTTAQHTNVTCSFFFSRSNWHENLLTWRSQRKQITKRFPFVLNKRVRHWIRVGQDCCCWARSAELV